MSETSQAGTMKKRYDRIEGWLVLIDMGLLLSLLRYLMLVMRDVFPSVVRQIFSAILDTQTASYQRLMAPVTILEAAGHAIFLIFTVVAAVYFNQRRKIAPKLMIIYFLASLAYQATTFLGGRMAPFLSGNGIAPSSMGFIQSLVVTVIWVTYFKISERVRQTFVR